MDGAPDLISNVTFSERKRGYDPEEVHNYLLEVEEQVGTLKDMARGAIERAEAAEARVAEARRGSQALEERAAAAERRAEEAEARAAEGGSTADPSAEAAGILAMAQRTADAAVAEAEERSRAVEADAATRAAEVVTEAEQRATERLAEARTRAEAMVEEARAEAGAVRDREMRALRAELDELERARGDLQRDVELLGDFLERRRAMLREALDQLAAVIDEPERLHLGAAPALSGTEVPPPSATAEEDRVADDEGASGASDATRTADESVAVPLGGAPDEGGSDDATAPEDRAGEADRSAGSTSAGSGRDRDDVDVVDEGDAVEAEDDELEDDEPDDDFEDDADELGEDDLETDDGGDEDEEPGPGQLAEKPPWYADDDRPEGGSRRRGPSRPPAVPVVTVEDLDGPATQAVPAAELFGEDEGAELDAAAARAERLALFPEEGDDSSFGRLDDEEDAAMRAFFESEPEGGEGRSRWGFGRKR